MTLPDGIQWIDLPDLPIRTVEDGDRIGEFRVHHTPGHTPGHVAYEHERLGAAFLGDLAIEFRGELRAADRITSYDAAQAEESVRTLLDRIHRFEYACPGHGRPLADGYEALQGSL